MWVTDEGLTGGRVMAFSISGLVGAGARDGLLELLAQRRLDEQLAEQKQAAQARLVLDQSRLNETMRRNAFDERRTQRADRVAESEGLASALDAGFDPFSPLDVEVSAGDAAKLAGTPQGARVREIPTIDAKPIAPAMAGSMGAPGVGVRRLTPSSAQQGARRVVGLRKRVSDELAGAQTDEQRRAAAAAAFIEGINVPNALTEPTAAETARLTEQAREQARGRDRDEWQWRQNYAHTLATNRPAKPMTPAERERARLTAIQQARRDARAEYALLKDPMTGESPVDLDTLTEEYEDEYLAILDAIEADDIPEGAAPGRGAAAPDAASVVQGMGARSSSLQAPTSGRRVIAGVRPRASSSGVTLRYDANGNLVR